MLLAGCAEVEPAPIVEETPLGMVRGVVVDEGIRPIEGADVVLRLAEGDRAAATDSLGRFVFEAVPAGGHFVTASHALYESSQVTVDVEPGAADPDWVNIVLVARNIVSPYVEAFKFSGFIQCGVDVIIQRQCAHDPTTLVQEGGLIPQAEEAAGDRARYTTTVQPGWTTFQMELVYEPTVEGHPERMVLALSTTDRTAFDWLARVEDTSPVIVRLDAGEQHATARGEPLQVPKEGHDGLLVMALARAGDGRQADVALQQTFEVLQHTFYHLAPPNDWSFARGDPLPF